MVTVFGSRSLVHVSPQIARGSLSWKSIGDGSVELRVQIVNLASCSTAPDTLVIEAAPFGAFIPHIPVDRVAVGSLDPGERRSVRVTLSNRLLDLIARAVPPPSTESTRAGVDAVLHYACMRHWIGNFNVYFESDPSKAFERHRAFDLRVPAGTTAMGMFMLISATVDSYSLKATVDNDQWSCATYLQSDRLGRLQVRAPSEVGSKANVVVEVSQLTSGRTVPIEFAFESADGWGDCAGCVPVKR